MKTPRHYSEQAIIWASAETDKWAKWHGLNDGERATMFKYLLDEYMANGGPI